MADGPPRAGIRSKFTLAQFNMLADGLAEFGGFPRAKLDMSFDKRWPGLLKCIERADADILCLQEVSRWEDTVGPAMESAGYTGCYVSGGASPAVSSGVPADGVAICVRSSAFRMVSTQCISLVDPAGKPTKSRAILAVLKCTDAASAPEGSPFDLMVATSHLKAKEAAGNEQTRVHQVRQILRVAQRAVRARGQLPASCPFVFCGDFNTTADGPAEPVTPLHVSTARPVFRRPEAGASFGGGELAEDSPPADPAMTRAAASGRPEPSASVFALLTGDRYRSDEDKGVTSEGAAGGAGEEAASAAVAGAATAAPASSQIASSTATASVLDDLRFGLPAMLCAYSEVLGGPRAVEFTTTKHRLVGGKEVAKRRTIDFIMVQSGEDEHGASAPEEGEEAAGSDPAKGSLWFDRPGEADGLAPAPLQL